MKDHSLTRLCRFANRWFLVLAYAWLAAHAQGQSSLRPQTIAGSVDPADTAAPGLMAEPKPQGANPFLPSVESDLRLPVTADGYCVVTLRERQEWLPGSESSQLAFDGKLYWFAGPRERAMFANTPRRYVPALGGDCAVTFAETGVRRRGNPRYGILHDQRLFFFCGPAEQKKFQVSPDRYAHVDLANGGLCLVSQIDEQRRLPGLPATTVIVNGISYRFAGVHQQRKFLTSMRDYGVERPVAAQADPTDEAAGSRRPSQPGPAGTNGLSRRAGAGPLDKQAWAELTDKAMAGYCCVSIRDDGVWSVGDPRYRLEFDGRTYLFVGEAEQKRFTENPGAYLPALGGDCVVTETNEKRRVPGSIYHASQYKGRLFLFAGAEQKRLFDTTTPEQYANADLAAAGNCLVSLVDEGRTVAGLPEFVSWHQGLRYFFASAKHQAAFRQNIERYQGQ